VTVNEIGKSTGVLNAELFDQIRSCKGLSAPNMKEVRRHVNGTHAQFVSLCSVCNEDFIDENEFNQYHGVHCRTPQRQRRREAAEIQWRLLFDKIAQIPVVNTNSAPSRIYWLSNSESSSKSNASKATVGPETDSEYHTSYELNHPTKDEQIPPGVSIYAGGFPHVANTTTDL